jgi:ribonucleoside-diphosphate reductase alpha chain
MATPELPAYIEISKYANYLEHLGRRELWPEMVERVFGMHDDFYGEKLAPVRERVDDAREMMLEKRALGSQRVLQFGGKPVIKHNAKVYNCTVSFADRPRFFQECFHLLLCGCGTGFSVQRHHVARMPRLLQRHGGRGVRTFTIPDSIEGWADALGVLVSSFMDGDVPFPEYQGYLVNFDASQVRPKGAPISSGSKAPGPGPLLLALERVQQVMQNAWDRGLRALRPIDVYDIVMHSSDAVLSGGVRRSASIALFSPDDMEMATAKTGDWYSTNRQRQRSNNSAVLLRDETPYQPFRDLIEHTRQWGDPGFYWTDSTEQMPNPCVETGMWPVWVHEDGAHESGWQMCNVSTTNGAKCEEPADFFSACRAAATMGTLQAGYTSFPYLGEISENIVRREALIGVSITGMMDQPGVLFDPDVLEHGAAIVKTINAEVAAAIGINPAARSTCLKPEGTSSCMLDTASGIHAHHSRRGIRHVEANTLEVPFQYFRKHNEHAVFPCDRDAMGNTELIAFPFEVPAHALTKADVSAMDMLERVILVQRHWVAMGTREELCTQSWLRHSVSNTVHVQDCEWDEVAQYIYDNREHFAGIALLGVYGDKAVERAPFVGVLIPEEQEALYGVEAVSVARSLAVTVPESFGGLWAACRALLFPAPQTTLLLTTQRDEAIWLGGLLGLADEYFSRDTAMASNCVKDVWLYDHWRFLMDNMKPVDYRWMHEAEDNVDFGGESGCAGGTCEVIYT